MKAVILAAGKGTRLQPFSEILPKPLMPVGLNTRGEFKTIIEYLIDQIYCAGIREIFLIVNYKADMIMNYLKEGILPDIKITYLFQSVLDGNGGAFYRAQHLLGGEDVLISDSDNFVSDSDIFVSMINFHQQKKAEITVGVSTVKHVEKFAIIKTDGNGNPLDIKEKPSRGEGWGNLAKSGMMILSNQFALIDKEISFAKEKEYTTTQMIKYALDNKIKTALFNISANFYDIGTWNEYIPLLRRNLLEK